MIHDPRGDVGIDGGGSNRLRLRITNPKIVQRITKQGEKIPMLRFDLIWLVETQGLKLGGKQLGCLAHKYYDHQTHTPIVVWSPTKSQKGGFYHQTMVVTPDLYEIVRKDLEQSEYIKLIGGPPPYMKRPANETPAPPLVETLDVLDTDLANGEANG